LTENQPKPNELAMLTQQLATLREQIDKANAETKPQIERRDHLNEKFKKIRQEVNELKVTRDNLNEKVQTLKQQRDMARVKIKAQIEEIKSHNQKITELKKKTPRESRRELQKEFEDIEWKIQTTPLDIKEEKRLVENVRQLETQLNVYRKIDQHIKIVAEIRKELEPLETNADIAHQELTATAEKSQEIHAKMMARINEAKDIKAEADSLHVAYIEAKEQVRPLHEEFKKLIDEKRKMQAAVREKDAKRKKNAEQILKEKLESQARNKLQRGEKLSWNEFKMLAADDEFKDAET
jgi:uncharacterized coiled-coil DUF342 family protein